MVILADAINRPNVKVSKKLNEMMEGRTWDHSEIKYWRIQRLNYKNYVSKFSTKWVIWFFGHTESVNVHNFGELIEFAMKN